MGIGSENYSIRKFTADDVMAYKAIRLEALQKEAGVFGANYAAESVLSNNEWKAKLAEPRRSTFGLYLNDILIGITGIIVDKDDPTSATMIQSYIQVPYRGKGLSKLLYEARIREAKQRGLKRLLIGHKETNTASKAANQKFGFTYTHKETLTWPDGSVEDVWYYELML